jgi:hypothetical protein
VPFGNWLRRSRGHVTHGFQHAARPGRIESAAGPPPAGLFSRSIRYWSGSLPAATAISSMKPCMTNETPLVGGARSAPVGTSNGVTAEEMTQTFSQKPRGNSLAGTTDCVLGTIVAEGDQLAGAVEPRLEKVVPLRPVLVVAHVIFARPQQLDRDARQPRAARSSVTLRAMRRSPRRSR